MKTYILDLIPRIKRFSQRLDHNTLISRKNWVLVDDDFSRKVVFIFREKDNRLLIAENGIVEKGSWEYLGDNNLLINRATTSYLFRHSFLDETILALKVDGKPEYALFVNESEFDAHLHSSSEVISFLKRKYGSHSSQRFDKSRLIKPPIREFKRQFEVAKSHLNPIPDLDDFQFYLNKLIYKIQPLPATNSGDIIISFIKHGLIPQKLHETNLKLSDAVLSKHVPTEYFKSVFARNLQDKEVLIKIETLLRQEILDCYNYY